jgi:spermidine synthase
MRSTLILSALVVLGGVAALSWESLWQLQASLAFGVSAAGTALTLAATTGGLALGSLLAGTLLRDREIENPLLVYGWLELAIGVAGLLMLPGFMLLQIFDGLAYAAAPMLAKVVQLAGIALVLAPATMAMGASVPVFQLIARAHGTRVSVLYGMNTAGAAIGVLLLGFVVLEQLGVKATCLAVAAVNAAAFLLTRVVARRLPVGVPSRLAATRDGSKASAAPKMSTRTALIVVTITGLVTFGLEVTWFRALRAAFWSTSQTFSILLAAVLIPLAIGARAVPWLRRTRASPAGLLAASGGAILLATPLIERMDLMVNSFPDSYYATLVRSFVWTLALVGPPILLLATVLPWALEDHPDTRTTGWLYGLNSLGAVVGSVLGAWVLLPSLGVARASWLLGGLMLSASLLAIKPNRRWIPVVAGGAALLLAVSSASSPGRDRMFGQANHYTKRILAHREGPDFTTSVIVRPKGFRVLLIDGFGASSENQSTGSYMHWMGSIPALLHSEPENALVICFGTGQTANGLLRGTSGNVDMVDISGTIFELAHFFRSNQGVLEDPRTRAIEMDGRAWLRRTDERYDVVTLEPMPPNFSGVNSLYSREFYQLLAERLNDDGVATQWLPVHLLSPEHSASIVATFIEVFPDALLWWEPVGGTGILVGRKPGSKSPIGQEWPGLENRSVARRLRKDQILKAVWLDQPALEEYAERGQIITDDNQMLQFGEMRSSHSRVRSEEASVQNQAIIEKVAGRPPFVLPAGRRSFSRFANPGEG